MTADIFLQPDSNKSSPLLAFPQMAHFFVSPLQLGYFGACNYYFPQMVNFGRASLCRQNSMSSSLLLFFLYFKNQCKSHSRVWLCGQSCNLTYFTHYKSAKKSAQCVHKRSDSHVGSAHLFGLTELPSRRIWQFARMKNEAIILSRL